MSRALALVVVAVLTAAPVLLAGSLARDPRPDPQAVVGHGATPSATAVPTTAAKEPRIGVVTGRWAGPEFQLMAATHDHAFGIGPHGEVLRIGDDGVRTLRLTPPDAPDMPQKIVADDTAVYVASEVIKRFTDRPDRIWRIDPDRMVVTADMTLDQSPWELAVTTDALYIGTPTSVLRLDPGTLHQVAAYRVPDTEAPPRRSSAVFTLAATSRQVYVGAGDAESARLLQLSPALHLLGWADLPRGQGTTLHGPDWLTTPDGSVHHLVDGVLGPGVPLKADTGVSTRAGLLAVTGSEQSGYTLVQVTDDGRVVATQQVPGDVAAGLAYDEAAGTLWLSGGNVLERQALRLTMAVGIP